MYGYAVWVLKENHTLCQGGGCTRNCLCLLTAGFDGSEMVHKQIFTISNNKKDIESHKKEDDLKPDGISNYFIHFIFVFIFIRFISIIFFYSLAYLGIFELRLFTVSSSTYDNKRK